ncbi:MAG: hypothetical protein WBH47_26895, partial [Streptosporangiaceae bacterium]
MRTVRPVIAALDLLARRTPGELAEAPYEIADRPDMAINAALRAVGIHAAWPADEFATVGLDRHRWTSEWVASPGSGWHRASHGGMSGNWPLLVQDISPHVSD